MPRLIFSNSNHLNTDISDEQGHKLYTISTPWAFHRVTTITKYLWSGSTCFPETLGVIEWHSFTDDTIQFQGKVTEANTMLEKRAWQTGRHFIGPDESSYKWRIEPSHCWLKLADTCTELARFHRRNLGIMKEAHPSYLDVSSEVVFMLDHIIITFIYVDKLREDQNNRTASHDRALAAGGMNTGNLNIDMPGVLNLPA